MWSLFVALTLLSTVAASPVLQDVTPGSLVLQDVTPGSLLQEMTTLQEVTPGSLLQEMTTESQQPSSLNVDQYLRAYGYMNDANELSVDYAQRRTYALRLFQSFADLEVTGEADEYTQHHMRQRRCGVKDIEIDRLANANVARWNVSKISYKIRRYTKDISRDNVRSAIAEALNLWSVPSKLTFQKIRRGRPIMDMKFVTGYHRPCRARMDGSGGVVAHAYFPQRHRFGGDIHFDDAESYKYKEDGKGVDLLSVALHEAGHALGLGHTSIKGSIMVAWYTGQTTLGPNDIERIQALYKK